MPVPSYTSEADLAAYMENVLGAVAASLGWTAVAGDFDEAVNEALLAYDVSDIEDATDIRKLRALARYYAWKAAAASLAAYYDFQSADERFNRSQMQKAAAENLRSAEADLAEFGVGPFAAYVDSITRTQDPYAFDPDREVVA